MNYPVQNYALRNFAWDIQHQPSGMTEKECWGTDMECKYCGYCWQDEWDDFPCCHFDGPEGWAPCEQEECENGL